MHEEDRFYRFEPSEGIFMHQRKQRLATILSRDPVISHEDGFHWDAFRIAALVVK